MSWKNLDERQMEALLDEARYKLRHQDRKSAALNLVAFILGVAAICAFVVAVVHGDLP